MPYAEFFSTNNIGDISDKYQVCIYISTYLSYVLCKYMFQFLAESMWWCWMVACPAMAGGDWTNPSTVFPKTSQTSSQNIRIYVALNIFSKHQNIRSAKHLLRIYLAPMFFSNIRAYLATNMFSNVKCKKREKNNIFVLVQLFSQGKTHDNKQLSCFINLQMLKLPRNWNQYDWWR